MGEWKIAVNHETIQAVRFNKKRKLANLSLQIIGQPISWTNTAKCLMLKFDKKMICEAHTYDIKKTGTMALSVTEK